MAQALQIDPADFDEAPIAPRAIASVASLPIAVAAVQPLQSQAMPAWYVTPVAVIPVAAGAFIIGNVLMMIPWSAF